MRKISKTPLPDFQKRPLPAAVILLTSQSHTEFLYAFTPTWACTAMEGDHIRIRARRADYPSPMEQRKHVTLTVGMIAGLRDATEV
jgi:hypothetical protein